MIWWSRYEIMDRVIDGEIVTPDDEQFWAAQADDLERAVERLTAGGARLVIVLTERPGLGTLSRSEEELESPVIQRLFEGDGYRIRFNEMVLELAARDPRVETIDGDALFCSPDSGSGALCDDTVEGVGFMRYDGSHVTLESFGIEVAAEILDAIFPS